MAIDWVRVNFIVFDDDPLKLANSGYSGDRSLRCYSLELLNEAASSF